MASASITSKDPNNLIQVSIWNYVTKEHHSTALGQVCCAHPCSFLQHDSEHTSNQVAQLQHQVVTSSVHAGELLSNNTP